jgi:membrane associated rhomboid family serine protease
VSRLQTWYGALPRALRTLLTINVVIYVLWILLLSRIPVTFNFVYDHLALNPDLPDILFEPWQVLTYNFLHLGPGLGGFLHILFNLLWLYWIGREYEDLHGPKPIVALYIITGIGGGLVTVALHAAFPNAAFFDGPVHGASASVLGVMTAVAVTYPQKKIGLFLLGTFRLIYLVIAFLVIDFVFLGLGGTAVGAHLGGALFGFLFVKVEQRNIDLTSWTRIFFRERKQPRRARTVAVEHGSMLSRVEAWLASRGTGKERKSSSQKSGNPLVSKLRLVQPKEEVEPSLEHEVDRILDKISEQGFQALTEEERRVLDEASRRLN